MNFKRGFTLIELIVSISVMMMVTGIFLANYSSANKRSDLTMTAQRMVADIRMAQNYALGLARYGNSVSTHVPLGGWGIHINLTNIGNDRYIIFADDNGDGIYNINEDNEAYGAKVVLLPKGLVVKSTSLGSVADVVFLPPDPIVKITNGSISSPLAANLLMVLEDTRTGQTKTIKANFLGLIEVID